MRHWTRSTLLCLVLLSFVAEGKVLAQWQILATLQTHGIDVVYFLDNENSPKLGFAGGAGLSQTTDRGITWTQILASVYQNGIISDITFKDGQTGWFSTINPGVYTGSIYKTTDGGKTWSIILTSTFSYYSGLYYNKTFGRLFLSDIFGSSLVSNDDGATWVNFAGAGHNGFSFMNDTVGICSSYNTNFLTTTNGGATWKSVPESREVWQPLALAVGNMCFAFSERNNVLFQSTDQGFSWSNIRGSLNLQNTGQIGGSVSKLYYQSRASGFYMSTDMGNSWVDICGPSGTSDTRFYIYNNSIYVGEDNIIWFNPSPIPNSAASINFATNIISISSVCSSLQDLLQLQFLFGCSGRSIQILSATISNQPIFTLNPSAKFPITIYSDTAINNLVFYKPRQFGSDTSYINIQYSISGPNGITIHDTILRLIGMGSSHDTITEIISPRTIKIQNGAVCKNQDTTVEIISTCGSFSLISLTLEDTSLMNFSLFDSLPLTISENRIQDLKIRLTPKRKANSKDTAMLKFTMQKKTFILTDSIQVIFDNASINNTFSPPIIYSAHHPCKAFDTTFTLTNPLCDSLTITSLSFRDSLSLLFQLPQTPINIQPGKSQKFKVSILSKLNGTFSNSIIVNYVYDGYADTVTIPITITVKNENSFLELSPLTFGTINICKTKDLPFSITNSYCDDITVTKIEVLPSSDFILVNPPLLPFILSSGISDTLLLNFSPHTFGSQSVKLHISIQYNQKDIDTLLTITGAANGSAIFSLDKPQINFDTISTCLIATKSAYFINDNCDSIFISQYYPLTGASFVKTNPPLPFWLHKNDSLQITILFEPKIGGAVLDSITFHAITTTGSNQYQTLVLSGYGDQSSASSYTLSSTSLTFDTLHLCDSAKRRIVLYTTGCDSLPLSSISVSGDADFRVSGIGVRGSEVATGDSVVLNVLLNPISVGNKSATITITLGDSSKITIPINGTILRAIGTLATTAKNIVDLGKHYTCDNSDTTITLTNPSCVAVQVLGVGFQGSGFGTNTNFPITLPSGGSTTIDIHNILDTSGGVAKNSSILTIISDADNSIAPINFIVSYILPHFVHLWLDADNAPHTAGSLWKVKLKGLPNELSDVRTIDLNLNYNSELINYAKQIVTNTTNSTDGKSFSILGTPMILAGADSTITELYFNVYLTKDTMTAISFGNIFLNSSNPKFMECVAAPLASGIDFTYLNICGDPSIRNFMLGKPIEMTIRPNPAQDEIEINLQSPIEQSVRINILNALGAKVGSYSKILVSGGNTIRLDIKDLTEGMYILNLNTPAGSASENFVKVK